VKFRPLDVKAASFLRFLPLFVAIVPFASPASAAPLCVTGDTLADYIPTDDTPKSCYVDAGLGVQLLFTFTKTSFNYLTDSASDPSSTALAAADFTVTPVTGPGLPQAGLRFQSTSFVVPGDATYADVNVTFGVSINFIPPGTAYLLNSAHLGLTGTPVTPDEMVLAGESAISFNLSLTNPSAPTDVPDVIFGQPQTSVTPNIDLLAFAPGSQITSWVESFDLGDNQQNSNVPEPSTLALFPGAILLFGLLRGRGAKTILPVIAVLTVLASKSHANAVCTDLAAINGGPVGSGVTSLMIDNYIAYTATYGGCTMNDMLFQITSFTTSGTAAITPEAAHTRLIFSITNNGNLTRDVQLQYLSVATTTTIPANQDLTFTFQYSVTAPTSLITHMTGSTSVTGAPTRTTSIVPNTLPAASGSPFTGLIPNITFNDPLNTTFTVTDTFHLAGPGNHVSSATDQFTEIVPEPLTSVLMGSALLGIGLLSRKRRFGKR
jgi:hypothetical protein